MALCPSHDDKKSSLSVTTGKDGRVLLNCHAGCAFAAVVAAAGLSQSDTFAGPMPDARPALSVARAQGVDTRKKLVKTYDYTDAEGTVLYQVCRYEPKDFRPRRRGSDGEWIYNLSGVEPVLYRLPEVVEAVESGRRIFLVEGEKDADALAAEGYPATTVSGGAKNWRPRHAETLKGSEVVILPDNDDAGKQYAEQAAADLLAAGCMVKVVALPELAPKQDVSDWLAKTDGDLEQLETLISRAPRWTGNGVQHRTRWRLDELLKDEEMMRPPPPVVPYLAWSSRSTLLAAREKSGKSTLTGYMAACVSRGTEFLDEPCEHGPVLIIGLEEFIGDTARRLRDFGAAPEQIHLVDSFRRPATEKLEEIEEHITAVRPVLVILDSLIAYSQGVITDANNSTQTQATVQGLTNLAHRTTIALVIIHHARKADGKYRDSSAIGGAVDVIAEVFPPDENADPNRRRVRPLGRVPARPVDFRYEGSRYVRVDAQGPAKASLEQRILDVVRERPGVGANDVADAVQENRRTVLDRLRLMVHNRTLINDGTSNYYRLRLPTYPLSQNSL